MKKLVFKKLIQKITLSFFVLTFSSAAGLCGMRVDENLEKEIPSQNLIYSVRKQIVDAILKNQTVTIDSILEKVEDNTDKIKALNQARMDLIFFLRKEEKDENTKDANIKRLWREVYNLRRKVSALRRDLPKTSPEKTLPLLQGYFSL
jgi:Mg2+ and Co2+ transporter CorA